MAGLHRAHQVSEKVGWSRGRFLLSETSLAIGRLLVSCLAETMDSCERTERVLSWHQCCTHVTSLLYIEWLRMRARACEAPRPTAESVLTFRIMSPIWGSPALATAPPLMIDRTIRPSPSRSGVTVIPARKMDVVCLFATSAKQPTGSWDPPLWILRGNFILDKPC